MPACRPPAQPHARSGLAALAAAALPVLAPACGEHAPAPVVVPSDVHLAAAQPAAAGGGRRRRPGDVRGRRQARGGAHRGALLPPGRPRASSRAPESSARAAGSGRGAPSRGVARFRFRSARVYAAPDARTLVLKARVRVHAGRGCPLPDGLAVLFFTLGRVGSAVGGWLITAVSTSP